MRLMLSFCLLASPLSAWEFTATPVCKIWHATDTAEMVVTYDPRDAVPYQISVTLLEGAWPWATPYTIRFDGPSGFAISTNRHSLSEDRSAVIAADTGFGNVLRGLEGNQVASALLGDQAAAIPLADAAPAVARFRDCTAPGLS